MNDDTRATRLGFPRDIRVTSSVVQSLGVPTQGLYVVNAAGARHENRCQNRLRKPHGASKINRLDCQPAYFSGLRLRSLGDRFKRTALALSPEQASPSQPSQSQSISPAEAAHPGSTRPKTTACHP